MWWIGYRHPDGKRREESSGNTARSAAVRLLRRRVGAKEHGLPVIPGVEKLTWEDGVKAVTEDFSNSGKKSGDEVERRFRLHLTPYFGGRRLVGFSSADARAYAA